jgi:hypothetical protein
VSAQLTYDLPTQNGTSAIFSRKQYLSYRSRIAVHRITYDIRTVPCHVVCTTILLQQLLTARSIFPSRLLRDRQTRSVRDGYFPHTEHLILQPNDAQKRSSHESSNCILYYIYGPAILIRLSGRQQFQFSHTNTISPRYSAWHCQLLSHWSLASRAFFLRTCTHHLSPPIRLRGVVAIMRISTTIQMENMIRTTRWPVGIRDNPGGLLKNL